MSATTKTKIDWSMILVGILLVIASIVLFAFPGLSLVTITIIAGIALVVAGIYDFIAYARMKGTPFASGWTIANGIIDIILGLIFFFQPIATAAVIPWIFALSFIFYGVFAIVMGIALNKQARGIGWLIVGGILAVLFGILLFIEPELFIIFLGLFVLIRGIVMMVYGFIAPRDVDYL